jgi:O-antigen/teichoic acid export membrane protein
MDNHNDQGGNFLVASSLKMLSSQYCLSIFNIFCFMYLLRVLTHVEVAIIAIFEILTSIYGFSELGLNSVMIKFCPSSLNTNGDSNKAYGLIKLTILVQGFVLFCMVGITYFFAAFISYQFLKTDSYAWAIHIISPGAALTILFSTLRGIAQVSEMYSLIARWIFLAGFLKQSIAIVLLLKYGFRGYIAGLTIASAISVISISISLRKFLINRVPCASFWDTFCYGFPLYLRSFMRYGFKELDQALVGLLLTPQVLATYSVARRFINYLNQAFEFIITPVMVRSLALIDSPSGAIQLFAKQSIRYFLFLTMPACVFVALSSPWLMYIYGGSKYFTGWPVLAFLSIGQLFYAINSIIAIYVFALKAPKATLIVEGAIGLFNYIFGPLLIIFMGLYGMITGQILGYVIGLAISTKILRQDDIFIQWSNISVMIFPLIISSLLTILGLFTCFNVLVPPLVICFAFILYLVIFMRKITEEDHCRIRALVPKSMLKIIDYIKKNN